MHNCTAAIYPLDVHKPELNDNVIAWLELRGITLTDACCRVLLAYQPEPGWGKVHRTYTLDDICEYVADGKHYLPALDREAFEDRLQTRSFALNGPVHRAAVRHLRTLGLLPHTNNLYQAQPRRCTLPEQMRETQRHTRSTRNDLI